MTEDTIYLDYNATTPLLPEVRRGDAPVPARALRQSLERPRLRAGGARRRSSTPAQQVAGS